MLTLFNKPQHRTGIALSGGGARGFAHAGALLALEQSGIRADLLAGVSAGSVAATMYAAGIHPRDILKVFSDKGFTSLASFVRPSNGFFSLDPFRRFLSSVIPYRNLEDLPVATVVGATNFDTGAMEYFTHGPIADIVAASCSIPIVFRPAEIAGTQYVDGGLLHNLPAGAIRDKCRHLIGVNCSPLRPRDKSRSNIVGTALRSYDLVAKSNALPDLALCDLQITIDKIADYTVFDLTHIESVFSAGYDAALQALRANPSFISSIKK